MINDFPGDDTPFVPENNEEILSSQEKELNKDSESSEKSKSVEKTSPKEEKTSPMKEEEVEKPSVFDGHDPDKVKKEISFLDEIMQDEDGFDQTIAKANPIELCLLFDRFNLEENIQPLFKKAGLIKKAFEKFQKNGGETLDEGIQKRFAASLLKFNGRRNALKRKWEEEKKVNSDIKSKLLEELKEIVEKEDVEAINKVRNIQRNWHDTGWVKQEDLEPFNTRYTKYLDLFYNLRDQYSHLREIDQNHNKKEKTKIINEIEALIPKEQVSEIDFHAWNDLSEKVQYLQDNYKSSGYVPREVHDELFEKFKKTCDSFYDLRRSFFEERDKERLENQKKKEEILALMERMAEVEYSKNKDWNNATKEFLLQQERWKEIGAAGKDVNKTLWASFRAVSDKFFNNKSQFFKDLDFTRKQNQKLKEEIIAKAEGFKGNTSWKETANALKSLQKDWKEIGPVPEKVSEKLWKKFRGICDDFFNARSEAFKERQSSEQGNLLKKEEIIKEILALAENTELEKGPKLAKLKSLQSDYTAAGYVPFDAKNALNNSYSSSIDKFFQSLNLADQEAFNLRFEAKMDGLGSEDEKNDKIKDEIRFLRRKVNDIEKKVDQYSLNFQYISKGKSGAPLREKIQKDIDSEKKRIEGMNKKLKYLKDYMNNPDKGPKKEPEDSPESETITNNDS